MTTVAEYTTNTKAKTDIVVATWIIEDFDLIASDTGFFEKSPPYRAIRTGLDWRIILYPNGECDAELDGGPWVSVYVEVENPFPEPQTCSITVKMINLKKNREDLVRMMWCFVVAPGSTRYGWGKYVQRNELIAEYLSINDAELTIELTAKISLFGHSGSSRVTSATTSERAREIGRDLKFILDNKILTDVTLEVQGKYFEAHRAILAARSETFRVIFASEMSKEKNEQVVPLKDIDGVSFEHMLSFVYTDKLPELSSEEEAFELLSTANLYSLEEVKLFCECYLAGKVNKDNAQIFAEHAEIFNAQFLKSAANLCLSSGDNVDVDG